MRRFLFPAAAAVAVLAGVVLAFHRGAPSNCFHVVGHHALHFRGVGVFDGERVLPPTDVLVVDQSIAEIGPVACIDQGDASLDEVPARLVFVRPLLRLVGPPLRLA